MNICIIVVTYTTGANIDVSAAEAAAVSESDRLILRLGSKLEFVSWYTYPASIWVLKFMVLFFYRRLTMGILRRKTITSLFWFCGISWAVLVIVVSLSCRPYDHNWQIRPLPGPECTFRLQNFWALLFLNVTSDAALMAIPIPILWHLQVSRRRKIAVSILLLSGLFVISTAIVRAIMTINGSPSVININRWGFRECTVGLLAVTAPILCPFFTAGFWKRGPYSPDWKRDSRWMARQLQRSSPRDEPSFGTWIGTFELDPLHDADCELGADDRDTKGINVGRKDLVGDITRCSKGSVYQLELE